MILLLIYKSNCKVSKSNIWGNELAQLGMPHLFAKYMRGKEPSVDYSLSNVLVMFDEYLGVLLMNKALVEKFIK